MRRSAQVTWDQVRVGLVLIAALAILAVGVFFVGQMGNVFGERYRLVTLMNSAAGLVPGAPVQVAGQAAGQVDRIEFIRPADRPETGEAVAVWVAIDVGMREQVRADSRAQVRTQGLLGDRLIDIEPGSPKRRALEEGDTLAAAPALSYQEMLAQAADAVDGLTRLSRNLGDLTDRLLAGEGTAGSLLADDGLYRELVVLSENLNAVLTPVAEGRGVMGRALTDDELYERLLSAVLSLDTLTAAAAEGEGTLGRLLRSDSLYVALEASATRADSLLAALQAGEGAIGKLLSDDRMYEEILKTLVDLNELLADLRENPRKYIPPVEVF